MTVDTSGKAEPKTPPAAPTAPKSPAQGENVAAIEAKVKAGEAINLTDLSDDMKKDKAAQTEKPKTARAKTTAFYGSHARPVHTAKPNATHI